ncbi:MAG TPA: hypothetical protein QGG93_08405 [Verrucomicrobiota bacterium]|nr:hypothetical protein [Verrucomicrobiota bacterium]
MSATQNHSTTVFSGRFCHGIDGSRRVMVPSKWRPKSGKTELSILPWPIGQKQFLLVLPPARWNVLLDRFSEISLSDEEGAEVERVIGGSSAHLTLDKAGRLCLPEELAAVAGLRKEAMFVGRLNKFEIWEPGRFKENSKGNEAVAAAAIKNLNL